MLARDITYIKAMNGQCIALDTWYWSKGLNIKMKSKGVALFFFCFPAILEWHSMVHNKYRAQ